MTPASPKSMHKLPIMSATILSHTKSACLFSTPRTASDSASTPRDNTKLLSVDTPSRARLSVSCWIQLSRADSTSGSSAIESPGSLNKRYKSINIKSTFDPIVPIQLSILLEGGGFSVGQADLGCCVLSVLAESMIGNRTPLNITASVCGEKIWPWRHMTECRMSRAFDRTFSRPSATLVDNPSSSGHQSRNTAPSSPILGSPSLRDFSQEIPIASEDAC
mmetsp:Transcript_25446/g.42438  ORF Transcript_25446/g.42438 Transcript_25446/m.42438 type:complete len:220 (-) Transcript_25446:1858-2517(-)